MRTIHADLVTAQQSGAADPYIYLSIGGTDYSSRLISLEHREEPYRDTAVIILANSDRHFKDKDLRGKSFTIGYGYVTASGNKYCGDGAGSGAMPTLWVKSQSQVSMAGELVCILYCEGGWMKLREIMVASKSPNLYISGLEPPYFDIPFSTTTIFGLIQMVLNEGGFYLNSLGTQDDDIVNAFTPILTVNPLTFENLAGLLYRLIQMTKLYLREVEELCFELIYPQASDSVNETYYSDKAPYFKEYTEKLDLLVPNHISVFCNREVDGTWNPDNIITGEALDYPDQFDADNNYIGAYTEIEEFHIAPYIKNQEDADKRADAILQRYKNETLAGRAVLPFHDCRVELYDRVEFGDNRGA